MRRNFVLIGVGESFSSATPPWPSLMVPFGKADPDAAGWAFERISRHPNTARRILWRRDWPMRCSESPDVFGRVEFHDDPLRMQGVVFTSEFFRQIRIALPVGGGVAVGEARIFVGGGVAAGAAAMRQRIAEGLADRIFEIGAAGEVAAFVRGIAPGAVGIPVPTGDSQFGVEAIRDRTPAGGEGFFEVGFAVNGVEVIGLQNVHGGAEGEVGIERESRAREWCRRGRFGQRR